MAQNKTIRLGPVAIGTAITNLFNPPTLTGGVNPPSVSTAAYYIIRHIRFNNISGTAATFSAYIGTSSGSTASTSIVPINTPIAANTYIDWFGVKRIDVADYVTASASALSSVNAEAEGEIGVV